MGEELRLVTILFADVSGSTALGEALDPVIQPVEAACSATIAVVDRTSPDPGRARHYDELYRVFRDLYPAVRGSMHALTALA